MTSLPPALWVAVVIVVLALVGVTAESWAPVVSGWLIQVRDALGGH